MDACRRDKNAFVKNVTGRIRQHNLLIKQIFLESLSHISQYFGHLAYSASQPPPSNHVHTHTYTHTHTHTHTANSGFINVRVQDFSVSCLVVSDFL